MSLSPNKNPDKIEAGRYAKKGGKISRLLWSIFTMVWALLFCVLGVLRANFSNPSSLIWALILLLLAVGLAYLSLYGITTWWVERKNR